MKKEVKSGFLIVLAVLLMLFAGGCGTRDSATYQLVYQAKQSIKWEGPVPKGPAYKSGQNIYRLEMVFSEECESADEQGNTVRKITLKDLKYNSKIKDSPSFIFDSTTNTDPNNALYKLVGQNYTIRTAANGEVLEVLGLDKFQDIGTGDSIADTTAARFVLEESIKDRHGLLLLTDGATKEMKAGDNWSGIKTFSFERMGTKVFERIYTVKEISDDVVVVEMNGIPSAEKAGEIYKQQKGRDFSKGFDNTVTYKGELKLDSNTGQVKEYIEHLESEWVSPKLPLKAGEEGTINLIMGAVRSYNLRKID
jgi:hypothetical protein